LTQIRKNGKSQFYQVDYDFPSLARIFGWNIRGRKCDYRGTDGTIDCPDCGKKVSEFIGAAIKYLDDHDGKVIIDRDGIFE
jgi:hypothetical protein